MLSKYVAAWKATVTSPSSRDVLSEVAEVGIRFYAGELTTGLRDRQGLDDAEVERVEVEMSNMLQKVLYHIEATKL